MRLHTAICAFAISLSALSIAAAQNVAVQPSSPPPNQARQTHTITRTIACEWRGVGTGGWGTVIGRALWAKNSLARDIPGGATLSWHYTRSTSSGSQRYDGERNIRGPLPSGRAIDVGAGFSGQAVSIGVVTACEMRATFTE